MFNQGMILSGAFAVFTLGANCFFLSGQKGRHDSNFLSSHKKSARLVKMGEPEGNLVYFVFWWEPQSFFPVEIFFCCSFTFDPLSMK